MSMAKFPLAAGILYRGSPAVRVPRQGMDLRCPNCNGADLKKVALAYQDGRLRVNTRTRLRGFVFGEGGPDVVVGRATTRGIQQTELSKVLSPPAKWSYKKLVLWSVFITLVALVVYIRVVVSSPPPVSSLPVKLYVVLAPAAFIFLVVRFWRHNHLVYPQHYAQWNRSFICERCGAPSLHDIPHDSLREP